MSEEEKARRNAIKAAEKKAEDDLNRYVRAEGELPPLPPHATTLPPNSRKIAPRTPLTIFPKRTEIAQMREELERLGKPVRVKRMGWVTKHKIHDREYQKLYGRHPHLPVITKPEWQLRKPVQTPTCVRVDHPFDELNPERAAFDAAATLTVKSAVLASMVPAPDGVAEPLSPETEVPSSVAQLGYTTLREFVPPKDLSFAVVDINGRQHKVMPHDEVMVQKLKGAEVGQQMTFDKVLLVGTRDYTLVGMPTVPDARVVAVVEEHTQTRKVLVFKKKRRKGFKRLLGHRDEVTILRILDVSAPPTAPVVDAVGKLSLQ